MGDPTHGRSRAVEGARDRETVDRERDDREMQAREMQAREMEGREAGFGAERDPVAEERAAEERAATVAGERADPVQADIERERLRAAPMSGDAVPRDPDTGAAGTTNPRSAVPTGSTRPTGVVPPKRGETKWLAIVGIGVVGVILILLLLT